MVNRKSIFALLWLVVLLIPGCDDDLENTVYNPTPVYYSLQDALEHREYAEELRLDNIGDSLSPEIGLLTHLFFLRIDDSEIRYLPDAITNLPQLGFLYLPNCKFQHIPPQICNSRRLHHLILDNNAIESIPDEFVQLKFLEGLYLNGNRLTEFRKEKFDSKYCLGLGLDSNRLTSFDFTRADLPKLNYLSLVGNPLPDSVKQRIREEFADAILHL